MNICFRGEDILDKLEERALVFVKSLLGPFYQYKEKKMPYNFSSNFFQVYYELDEERSKSNAKDVAICRVEQLCPFPYDLIQRELKRYPSMFSNLFL